MTSTLGHEKKALKLKSSKNTGLTSLEHNGLHLEVLYTQDLKFRLFTLKQDTRENYKEEEQTQMFADLTILRTIEVG